MIKKIVWLFIITLLTFTPSFAVESQLKYQALTDFEQGMIKFKESNINVAYEDFLKTVRNPDNTDFVNITLAGKLSDIGLYNLANEAILHIKDSEVAQIPIDNIRSVYHQEKKMDTEDEIYLSECYSNIIYNNQSKEIAAEITANSELRAKYDYANYINALAWYKSANLEAAMKYIDTAITENPKNISYKFLQAKIYADMGNKDKSVKILDNIKKNMSLTNYYNVKLKELEQYILYKSAKTDRLQSYHLAYYYYYRGDYLRSLKELPQANSKNKKENSEIYMLISKNYVELKEYEKAFSNAIKSFRADRNNADTLIILGDLKYLKGDYRNALKYYKEAMKKEKTTSFSSIKAAKAYLQLDKLPKAQEILLRVLRSSSEYYEAYYLIALIEPYKEEAYLKKSVAINTEFTDGWLELANFELERGNSDIAQVYLNNAYNLDQNDYKYYYYQGLLYKNKNDMKNATYNFEKSLKINPKFVNVQKELKK